MAKVLEEQNYPGRPLARPVAIVLETVEELNWAYSAFSNSVHMKGVEEDSRQQQFYCKMHADLNAYAAKYRR